MDESEQKFMELLEKFVNFLAWISPSLAYNFMDWLIHTGEKYGLIEEADEDEVFESEAEWVFDHLYNKPDNRN